MKIILKGKPQSTNHLYAVNARSGVPIWYMTPEGKTMKESYGWQAREQYRGKPLKGYLETHIKLFFDDRRRRDIDNYGKILQDSLSGIVWEDDCQIRKSTIEFAKGKPHIEIDINML